MGMLRFFRMKGVLPGRAADGFRAEIHRHSQQTGPRTGKKE